MFNATKDGITKMLAASYTPLTILPIPFLSFYWVAPKMKKIIILIGFTSLATIGQILMVGSFSFAAATIIAPFVYTQIIWATSVGFFTAWRLAGSMELDRYCYCRRGGFLYCHQRD